MVYIFSNLVVDLSCFYRLFTCFSMYVLASLAFIELVWGTWSYAVSHACNVAAHTPVLAKPGRPLRCGLQYCIPHDKAV